MTIHPGLYPTHSLPFLVATCTCQKAVSLFPPYTAVWAVPVPVIIDNRYEMFSHQFSHCGVKGGISGHFARRGQKQKPPKVPFSHFFECLVVHHQGLQATALLLRGRTWDLLNTAFQQPGSSAWALSRP
jgi:hypothetical protein